MFYLHVESTLGWRRASWRSLRRQDLYELRHLSCDGGEIVNLFPASRNLCRRNVLHRSNKNRVLARKMSFVSLFLSSCWCTRLQEERSKVDDLRGTPMSVGNLEEIIDDNHAIVSTSVGSEHYVSMLSFVDKDQLEPGCSVLLNHKVRTRLSFVLVVESCWSNKNNPLPKFDKHCLGLAATTTLWAAGKCLFALKFLGQEVQPINKK